MLDDKKKTELIDYVSSQTGVDPKELAAVLRREGLTENEIREVLELAEARRRKEADEHHQRIADFEQRSKEGFGPPLRAGGDAMTDVRLEIGTPEWEAFMDEFNTAQRLIAGLKHMREAPQNMPRQYVKKLLNDYAAFNWHGFKSRFDAAEDEMRKMLQYVMGPLHLIERGRQLFGDE
jgi:hypothetical protein